ncbi:MAG: hypothetical protein R3C61_10530 [Bacteroidia bacterium]
MTDRKAWERVINDRTYGPQLKEKFDELTESGNYLRLDEGLHEDSKNKLGRLKKIISTIPD